MDAFHDALLRADPFPDIIGQETAKDNLRSALLAGRHVIIIGPPGIGKTTIAKNVAKLLPGMELNDCAFHCSPATPACPECKGGKTGKRRVTGAERFVRIQGSPDLTVEDMLGDIDPVKALKFGPLSIEAFTPGKVFKANNGILFFDELNRCPEKLQNALLQVLEERRATIGAYDVDLVADFIFIGTMNPEDSSTERLSDVLLDRFDVIMMGHPDTLDMEVSIVKEKSADLGADVPDDILDFAVAFVRKIRQSDKIEKRPGVRATMGLYERAQANARIAHRDRVTLVDVQDAIISVLVHRIKLKPSVHYLKTSEDFVREELASFLKDRDIPITPVQKDGG